VPFYSPDTTTSYTNIPPNPPADKERYRSPSNDDQSVEYPTISDFFVELETTDRGNHYFTNYTNLFNQHGYFHLDELAVDSLTAERMVEIIPGMTDGTARAIKTKVSLKIKKIKGGNRAKH
jgi:hypothetical protein